MRTKLIIFLGLVFSQFVIAQEVNCDEKVNQFSKFVADKEYQKASEVWDEIKVSCATKTETIYVLESSVLQYNIDNASPENLEKKVRELLQLYDLYDKNFPANTNGNFEKRAMALYNNKIDANDEIYHYLDQAFRLQNNNFVNSQAIFNYFKMCFDQYKLEKVSSSNEKIIAKYMDVVALINANIQKLPFKSDEYKRVIAGMNSLVNGLLTCESLTAYVSHNFSAHKTDVSWLTPVGETLFNNCANAPVFESVALNLHQLKPSSKSAYYLATYYLNTAHQDKAIEFYTQSASLETDTITKASTFYTIASILSLSNRAKSAEMVHNAIQSNPSNGSYYIFLANLYANSVNECASTELERKALYKLASNTALKAALIEPRLKATSEQMSKDYMKNAVLSSKVKIKPVSLGCWINQTVQF